MEKNRSQIIREAASNLGDFTINDLTEPLHVYSYEEKRKIRESIKQFVRTGEIVSLNLGVYRYKGRNWTLPLIARMWRGMRIKEYFSIKDIVRISGASKSHARKYFKFLEEKGIIENCSGRRGYKEGAYRIVDPDNAPLEHIKMPMREDRK